MGIYQFDKIVKIKTTLLSVPLKKPVSDAKVIMGKQKPLTEVFLTCVEIKTNSELEGMGFTYALRAGGYSQYELAKEFAPILLGEDPNDISCLWDKLGWAGNTLGESGLINQTITAFDIALWDIKAKRAKLPISKFIGMNKEAVPCYNTSSGYLQAPIEEVIAKSKVLLDKGMGGIKLKVGRKNYHQDIDRIRRVREALGPDIAIMVDANQQWDLATALRAGRELDKFDLVWLEEPLNAYDIEGHKKLTDALGVPIGTGEMLTSFKDVNKYIEKSAVNLIMPDIARLGGITPFLKVLGRAKEKRMMVAPHFMMELQLPLAATYSNEVWIEHIEWLQPIFNEKVRIENGKMIVPQNLGMGLTFNKSIAKDMIVEETLFV